MDDSNTGRSTVLVVEDLETDGREFATAVLTTIAAESESEPTALPPLRETIDPDILEAFLDVESPSTKTLSFEYYGYEVLVTDDGCLCVRSLA